MTAKISIAVGNIAIEMATALGLSVGSSVGVKLNFSAHTRIEHDLHILHDKLHLAVTAAGLLQLSFPRPQGYLFRNHDPITPTTTPSSSSRSRLSTSMSDQLRSRLHGKQKHAFIDRPKSNKIEIQWTHVRMYGKCIHRRGTINKRQMELKLGKKRLPLHIYGGS